MTILTMREKILEVFDVTKLAMPEIDMFLNESNSLMLNLVL